MTRPPDIFDRGLLARRRARVAGDAGRADFLLRRVADDIAERLLAVKRTFATAAEIGAHHGILGRHLKAVAGVGEIVAVEDVGALARQCDGPRVVADLEALPLAEASLDLVVSGLSLTFVNDLPGVLAQVHRALKPDGLLLAAVLGPRTLHELRSALLEADAETTGGASPRVAPFADVRDLGSLLQRAQFALPVTDSDLVTVAYADALALMRDLRAMGATNVLAERTRRPLRRDTLAKALEIYQERYARPDGRVTATFEIVTMTGWKPHPSQQTPLRPGSAAQRLADALGTREVPTGDKPPRR